MYLLRRKSKTGIIYSKCKIVDQNLLQDSVFTKEGGDKIELDGKFEKFKVQTE